MLDIGGRDQRVRKYAVRNVSPDILPIFLHFGHGDIHTRKVEEVDKVEKVAEWEI